MMNKTQSLKNFVYLVGLHIYISIRLLSVVNISYLVTNKKQFIVLCFRTRNFSRKKALNSTVVVASFFSMHLF